MAKASFTISDGTKITTVTEKEEITQPKDFSINDFVAELKDDLKHNRLKLPTMPTIAIEALMVLNDADSSASDLVKVISKDTALTARLIRYANSPLYGMAQQISSIKSAITCIGFQKVKNAIYAVCMHEVFKTSVADIQKRMEELWEHSVKVAARAVALARSHPELDADVALVAGLIHDIGKIPLLIKLCEYEAMVEHEEFIDQLLHKLHPGVGQAILKLWGFDPVLVAVAAEHENIKREASDSAPDYIDVVQVANILSYDGTGHPLAGLARDKVTAFARLGLGEGMDINENGGPGVGDVEGIIL